MVKILDWDPGDIGLNLHSAMEAQWWPSTRPQPNLLQKAVVRRKWKWCKLLWVPMGQKGINDENTGKQRIREETALLAISKGITDLFFFFESYGYIKHCLSPTWNGNNTLIIGNYKFTDSCKKPKQVSTTYIQSWDLLLGSVWFHVCWMLCRHMFLHPLISQD